MQLKRVFLNKGEQTNCKTYFYITGEFENNDEVSGILGIKNTHGHNVGDPMEYIENRLFDWAMWEFGTEYENTVLADDQAVRIIEQLEPLVDKLLIVKEKYNCEFILMQVPYINKGMTTSIGYNKAVIDFCYKTGTEIQVDMYVNPFSEDDIEIITIDDNDPRIIRR
jgi:hypothetical protein